MFETRRDALKLSVLTAVGLAACQSGGNTPLLGIQPVNLAYQPDILINLDQHNNVGSWIYLQYSGTQYYAFKNKTALTLSLPGPTDRVLPDLNVVSNDIYWEPFTGNSISISNSSATLTLQQGSSGFPSTTTAQAISTFANQDTAYVSQTGWNEIGRL
jgi:hypothetical protein